MDARIEIALAQKRGHSEKHVEELRVLFAKASPEAVAICRAWHGETFGFPGHGCADLFVSPELERAEKAAQAMRDFISSAKPAR